MCCGCECEWHPVRVRWKIARGRWHAATGWTGDHRSASVAFGAAESESHAGKDGSRNTSPARFARSNPNSTCSSKKAGEAGSADQRGQSPRQPAHVIPSPGIRSVKTSASPSFLATARSECRPSVRPWWRKGREGALGRNMLRMRRAGLDETSCRRCACGLAASTDAKTADGTSQPRRPPFSSRKQTAASECKHNRQAHSLGLKGIARVHAHLAVVSYRRTYVCECLLPIRRSLVLGQSIRRLCSGAAAAAAAAAGNEVV